MTLNFLTLDVKKNLRIKHVYKSINVGIISLNIKKFLRSNTCMWLKKKNQTTKTACRDWKIMNFLP